MANKEELIRRIERRGFKVSRVTNDANPKGLYVARVGSVVYFSAKTLGGLHRQIFGY